VKAPRRRGLLRGGGKPTVGRQSAAAATSRPDDRRAREDHVAFRSCERELRGAPILYVLTVDSLDDREAIRCTTTCRRAVEVHLHRVALPLAQRSGLSGDGAATAASPKAISAQWAEIGGASVVRSRPGGGREAGSDCPPPRKGVHAPSDSDGERISTQLPLFFAQGIPIYIEKHCHRFVTKQP